MKLLTFTALCLSVIALQAEDGPKTFLAEPGKQLFSDDLKLLNTYQWKMVKGEWDIIEGNLRAQVAKDETYGALRHQMPLKDAVVTFEFKFDGAKGGGMSFAGSKGQVCRLNFAPGGFGAQKDDADQAGPDKLVPFGRRPLKLANGEWHSATVEIVGDTIVGRVDDAAPVAGSHEAIAQPKIAFTFYVSGQSYFIRNLRVYEAKPKADAAKVKEELIAATPKPVVKGE